MKRLFLGLLLLGVLLSPILGFAIWDNAKTVGITNRLRFMISDDGSVDVQIIQIDKYLFAVAQSKNGLSICQVEEKP